MVARVDISGILPAKLAKFVLQAMLKTILAFCAIYVMNPIEQSPFLFQTELCASLNALTDMRIILHFLAFLAIYSTRKQNFQDKISEVV